LIFITLFSQRLAPGDSSHFTKVGAHKNIHILSQISMHIQMSYFCIHSYHSLCVLELSAQKQRNISTQISRVMPKMEKQMRCKSLKNAHKLHWHS